ncbi:hypothetical protein ES705_46110 [subsurface metagenome]
MFTEAPHIVPTVVEFQVGVVGPKTIPVFRKYPFVQVGRVFRLIIRNDLIDLLLRQCLVIQFYFVNKSIERICAGKGIFPYRVCRTPVFSPAYLNIPGG